MRIVFAMNRGRAGNQIADPWVFWKKDMWNLPFAGKKDCICKLNYKVRKSSDPGYPQRDLVDATIAFETYKMFVVLMLNDFLVFA